MRNRLTFALPVLFACALISCTSCNSSALRGELGDGNTPAAKPSMEQLRTLLMQDLAKRGIDPARVVASPPSGIDNKPFDLAGALIDPDGSGPGAPTGVTLTWGEVLKGDYDENGEVGISDLTPLGANFSDLVTYDPASSHDGFAGWPAGDYTDDGGAGAGNPPVDGSPAKNWRKARVDGDSNGEINLADITPIGAHFGQTMTGYSIYRKLSGETDFTRLPNAVDSGLPYTIARPALDTLRTVRYSFEDDFAVGNSVSYYVVAYDAQSATEGTPSDILTLTTIANDPPVAAIVPDSAGGQAPISVNFDASTSTDADGTIDQYEWDLDGDGTYETDSGAVATNNFNYTVAGSFNATVRVTDNLGATDTASVTITITAAPPTGHAINGTILDDASAPVAGVSLLLTPGNVNASTDANGAYTFSNVDDGNYDVTPTLSGYSFDPVKHSIVMAGSDKNGIDFTAHNVVAGNLTVSGRIGQLFEPPPPPGPGADPWDSCNPLPGVHVKAFDNSNPSATLGTAISDASGNFTITGLPNIGNGIMVVEITDPPPSGDSSFGWGPTQGQAIFTPFQNSVPGPGVSPNADGQNGPTFIDTNNFA